MTIGDSLIIYKKETTCTTAPVNKNKSNGTVQNPFEKKEVSTTAKPQKQTFNYDELYDKYKNNPTGVLKELGLPTDSKELKAMLKDKSSLKVLLTIAKKDKLNAEDLCAAFKEVMNQKGSNIFKRGWIWLTNGFKGEKEVNAHKLSQNMNDVREVRGEEFSTETVLNVGKYATKGENEKANAMHFVKQETAKGEFLYSEKNVTDAVNYMAKEPEKADKFVINATELESIKDEKGANKYTGDTNISVGKRMTQNENLATTMKKVAHKKDMTDEFLENITSNLEKTPEMQGSIEFSLDAKNSDGTDRFSAKSINTESNQLVNQSEEFCKNYESNLRKISQYSNLSSEEIVSISESITQKPEIANDVIAKIESGKMSGEEIANYAKDAIKNELPENETYSTEPQSEIKATATNEVATQNTQTNETIKNKAEETFKEQSVKLSNVLNSKKEEITSNNTTEKTEQITISGVKYNKTEIKRSFETQFGSMADEILIAIQKDPKKIDTIKQYANSPTILKAYLEDEVYFSKIKNAIKMSNSELEEILALCTDASSKELMLAALEQGSVSYALKTVRYAKITNSKDDAHQILASKTLGTELKKNKLEELYGMNNKKGFSALS